MVRCIAIIAVAVIVFSSLSAPCPAGVPSVGENPARDGSRGDDPRIPQQYEQVLRQAGWLSYVSRNIDDVEFVDSVFIDLELPAKMIGGRAMVRNGRRKARVATRFHGPVEVARLMVHEAAHLEPYSGTGRMGDEAYATQTHNRFLADYREILRLNSCQQLDRLSEKARVYLVDLRDAVSDQQFVERARSLIKGVLRNNSL